MNESMWTLEEGVKFIRWIEPKLAEKGFHCALTGGVIFKGKSVKDLDVIVYPHTAEGMPDFDSVWPLITDWCKSETQNSCQGTSQIRDEKDVRWLQARGKRVDFFFLT